MNFSLFVIFVIVVHCAQGKRYLQYIVNDKHNRISEIFDTYSRFASFSPLWFRTGRFKDFTLPIDIKRGILTNLKRTLILRQLINLTLISSQPWNQPQLKKKHFLHILETILISRPLENSQVSDIHNVSLMASEEGCERFSCRAIGVLIVCVNIFKYQRCTFSQRSRNVPWFVLLLKQTYLITVKEDWRENRYLLFIRSLFKTR